MPKTVHTKSPTVDHVRTLESLLIFDVTHPVHILTLPQGDDGELLDVYISLHGERAPYLTLGVVPFNFPTDLHIYFVPGDRTLAEAVELTSLVVEALQTRLRALKPATREATYRDALELLLRVEGAPTLQTNVNSSLLAADKTRIASLVTRTPEQLLSALGDQTIGLGGSQHAFNWIFTHIPIAPLSLADILASVKSPPYNLDLRLQERPRLVFSHGPLERLDTSTIAPAGALRITVESVFHTSLEDEFNDLEQNVRLALVEIQKKFRAGSPLMQAISNIDDYSARVGTDIAALNALIESARLALASLTNDAAEIKAKLAAFQLPTNPLFPGMFR